MMPLKFAAYYRREHNTASYRGGEATKVSTASETLSFDLLTFKVVSEPTVTRATAMPILVFLGLFILHLGPVYATDRRQTASFRQHYWLMPRLGSRT